ncbi:MAG: hypothetical protein PHU85_00150 [Phycisphaerae bacterium]|nr:hypothetical protein [Phycisphaerae bacterium]
MGVVRVWVKYATPTDEERIEDGILFRSYGIVYGVKVSSGAVSGAAVALSPLIPRWGSYYSYNGHTNKLAFVRRRKIRMVAPLLYEAEITWDTNAPPSPAKQEASQTNPLLEPVEWDGDTVVEEKFKLKDTEDTFFANSVGCPFEQGLAVSEPYSTVRATRNEGYYNWKLVGEYVGKVNQYPFGGCPAETVKLLRVTWREVRDGDYAYVKVSYEFGYNPEGWKHERLDAGPYYLETDEQTGEEVRVDVHANGKVKWSSGGNFFFGNNGQVLTEKQIKDSKGDAIKKLTFKNHGKKDFSRLGLVYEYRPPRTRSNQPRR